MRFFSSRKSGVRPARVFFLCATALTAAAVATSPLLGCQGRADRGFDEGDRIELDNGYEVVVEEGWRARKPADYSERTALEMVGPSGQWTDIAVLTVSDATEYMSVQQTLIAKGDSDGRVQSTRLWGDKAVVMIGTADEATGEQQMLATLWGASQPTLLQLSRSDRLDEMVKQGQSATEILKYVVDTVGLRPPE